MTYRLAPLAVTDIEEIADYTAQHDASAAQRWIEDIRQRCHALGRMPGMGVSRAEVRPELRVFPVGKYMIFYRQVARGVEIIRVVHGARRWQELLPPGEA